jgi:hypothetical protein
MLTHAPHMRLKAKRCNFCGSLLSTALPVAQKYCKYCRQERIRSARAYFQTEKFPAEGVGNYVLSGRRLARVRKKSV